MPRGGRRPERPPGESPPAAATHRRRRTVPVLVLFAVLGIGVGLVIEALQSGRVEDAIGALLVLAFVALMAWRATRSGR